MKANLCQKLHDAQKGKDVAEMRVAVEKFAAIFPDKDKKLWVPLQHYLQGLDIPSLDKSQNRTSRLPPCSLEQKCKKRNK